MARAWTDVDKNSLHVSDVQMLSKPYQNAECEAVWLGRDLFF